MSSGLGGLEAEGSGEQGHALQEELPGTQSLSLSLPGH